MSLHVTHPNGCSIFVPLLDVGTVKRLLAGLVDVRCRRYVRCWVWRLGIERAGDGGKVSQQLEVA